MQKKIIRTLLFMSVYTFCGFLASIMLSTVLIAGNSTAQSVKEVKISIYLENATIPQTFEEIEKKTPFRFLYNRSVAESSGIKISLKYKSDSVEQILIDIADQSGVTFRQAGNTIVAGLPDELNNSETGMEIMQETISGQVIDSGTGEVLPGVNIVVAGSEEITGSVIGTQTDLNGEYEIHVPDELNTLRFTYIGYETLEIDIDGRNEVDVQLTEDIQMLDDIVVVGYGTQERLSLTNSVTQLRGEDIARRTVSDVSQSLQGFAPGLFVLDHGGRPGNNNVDIRVRGVTTLGGAFAEDNKNNPLILVDGIESSTANVNPDDIESVSVLKDASSTAIYGSRAANGVILITTKRGESGRINVNYDGYYAIQDATNRPEHMDLESYFRLENVAYENAGRVRPYSEEFIADYVANAPSPEYPLPFPWFRRDELGILELAPQQNHTLSISGGNETARARASIRYQTVDGIAPNFSSEVSAVRINTDLNTPSERLRFTADLHFRNSEDVQPGGVGGDDGEHRVFNYMLHATKFSWPKYDTGEYGLGPQVNNPLLFAELTGEHRRRIGALVGRVRGEYEIIPGFAFLTEYALRYSTTQVKRFRDRYHNQDPVTGRVTQRQTNSLLEQRNNAAEQIFRGMLRYSEDFEQHGITAQAGYETTYHEVNGVNAYREGFYNNNVQALSQGSSENIGATGSDREFALRSFFGRLNYDYNDKYLVEANARYDGSSRFSEENRYSFFPSFSVGWRVSQESFWNNFGPLGTHINELKLRGSWGATGNQAVGLYTYYETLSSLTYSFNEQPVPGFTQTALANQHLTWETTKQTNIGLDLEAMNNRILFSFDYYNKVTEDILLELPIPGLVGLQAPPQNAGEVQNKGYEISVNYRGGNRFRYNIGFNFSDNRNEVLDLAGTGPFIDGGPTGRTYIRQAGLPIDSHWGYLTDGLFQNQDEIDNYPTLSDNTAPGDVKYLDLNEDGVISPDDRTYLGLSFPQYDFGADMNFFYKNFELFMQWQGAAGHKTTITGGLSHIAYAEAFTHAIYTNNYWTPENPDARFQRPIKGDSRNRHNSDRKMIKGDYLRLKNIVLSYNIPISIAEKFSVQNARIYVGATNVLTFSELNEWNLDPETPSSRANYYPQVSTYTVGINLQF